MERIFVRHATKDDLAYMESWLATTRDGALFDFDVLKHETTFVLSAFSRNGLMGCVPVQQPLMMENLIFRPGLSTTETAAVIARLGEHAVEETIRRGAGELYYLCRDESTILFGRNHLFRDVYQDHGLKTYRLNLVETFGE